VPLTGFKLYSLRLSTNEITLEHDGTDHPEILTKTVENLVLDEDYNFFVTGLNPYEGEESDQSVYRAAGRPQAVTLISEIDGSRTGQRIGLEWTVPSSNGGSPIQYYTLALSRENQDDEVVYHGLQTSTYLEDLTPGKSYTFHVKATNMVGDSEFSPKYTFLMVDEPTQPLKLSITSFTDT
jgi:hypothetical protein